MLLTRFDPQMNLVSTLYFSPNGQRLAATGSDPERGDQVCIAIFSTLDWRLEQKMSFVAHSNEVGVVGFDPNGERFATAGGQPSGGRRARYLRRLDRGGSSRRTWSESPAPGRDDDSTGRCLRCHT